MPRAQEKDMKPASSPAKSGVRKSGVVVKSSERDNILRAAKMHAARLKVDADSPKRPPRNSSHQSF